MNWWLENTPAQFWRFLVEVSDAEWLRAIQAALPILELPQSVDRIDQVLESVLGEGRFGPHHWQLGLAKRVYYQVKPLLPRPLTRKLRQLYRPSPGTKRDWPVEDRYARFLWMIAKSLGEGGQPDRLPFLHLWPNGKQFGFVLTHDIETAQGQAFVREVMALETSMGFRSSFNFVPERYPLDYHLMAELKERGFEVGVHGLKHDGKLFSSEKIFARRAAQINRYLHEWGAVGFRAPLTHRHPDWMQRLNLEYDLSFFDTDPFEPIPGGTMSLWPFMLGRFVELPYTLVQDYVLTAVLGETTPCIWLEKVNFLAQYHGMALLNTHPDYLRDPVTWQVYHDFLASMKQREAYWHALPREVAAWWRARNECPTLPACATQGKLTVEAGKLQIELV